MSYSLKYSPEIQVWAEPLANIPYKTIDAFVVADLLADLMGLGSNSGGIYVRGSNKDNWSDWVNIGPDLTVNNVGFMRFDADARIVTDAGKAASILSRGSKGGFYALPVTVPRDNIVGESVLSNDNTVLQWIPAQGDWKSVRAMSSKFGGSGVGLYCSDADALVRSSKVAQNVSIRGSIQSLGVGTGNGNREENRLIFGNQRRYSMHLKQGMPVTIESYGRRPDNTMGWNVMKALDDVGAADLIGNEYHFSLAYRAGRLVYDVNGATGWVGGTNAQGGFVPISWDEAPIQFQTTNSRARLDVAFDEHKNADGSPITGTVSRKVNFNGPTRPSESLLTPLCGGYQVGGKCDAATTADGQSVTYTATLTPDDTGNITPFLAQILLAYAPVWAGGAGSPAINLTPAVESVDLDLSHPPTQDGSKGDIGLNGAILEKLVPGWNNVLQDFCPITVRGRWRDSDGVAGKWTNLFFGYQYGIEKNVTGWNSKAIRVPVNDSTLRLREPAAIIKENYYPLDLLLSNKNTASNLLDQSLLGLLSNFPEGSAVREISRDLYSGAAIATVIGPDGEFLARVPVPPASAFNLYGGECVQEILRLALGPAMANLMNGDGDPMRFFSGGHMPIMPGSVAEGSYLSVAATFKESLQAAKLGGSFALPPKYGSDALSWIGDFASDENAEFLFSRVGRNLTTGDATIYAGRPVPVYGRYEKFLLTNALRWQFDETATPSNLNNFLESFTNQTRPEKNYNEVLVLADLEGGDNSGLYPALRMGVARLGSNNPNAALHSWARTLVVRSNYGYAPGGAEALAYNLLRELSAVTAKWPDYSFRGEGFMQPGDLLFSKVLNNTNPSLENVYFRAKTIRHSITINGTENTEWKTTASCQPLSRSQLAAVYGNGSALLTEYYLNLI